MKQLRREESQSTLPIQQQFREGMTIEQRVAIINKETKSMMSTGNYLGAIECCNEAIALNNSSLAVINRAYCYKHIKNWQSAIDDFTLALMQDPTHPAPLLAQRGICYGKMEKYELALADLNTAVELDPSHYNCFNRGCILADASEYESAIIDFNRVIMSKDSSDLRTRSIYHRAGTLVKLKRYEDAIEDLRGLLRADPNSLYPRMLLGKALKMIGDLQGAEESVSRGIDLDPKLSDSYIERGDIRCRMGTKRKIDEAIADFQAALNLLKKESSNTSGNSNRMSVIQMVNNSQIQPVSLPNIENSETRHNAPGNHMKIVRALSNMSHQSEEGTPKIPLVRSYSSSKSPLTHIKKTKLSKSHSRSEGTLRERTEVVPFFGNRRIASCLIKLAQARLLIPEDIPEHTNYHSAALRDAETAIRIIPSDINFSLVCVVCYIRLEQYDRASELLDSLLGIDPCHKKVLYHRAFCYRAINNSFKAIECLTKIISHTPTNSIIEDDNENEIDFMERVYEMRGTLLHEQKAYKIAVVDFGKAIALRPNRPENYYFRGSCHCKLGNFERAISDFTIAEMTGFTNIPFLLMEKGATLRIMGRSKEACEVFDRAIAEFTSSHDLDLLQNSDSSNFKPYFTYFRLSMFYAMCLLDLENYQDAEIALLKLHEFTGNRVGLNDMDDNSSKDRTLSLNLDTINGSSILPLDGHLQWILKYHLAMCSHMQKDYIQSQELLCDCVTTLRSYAPDSFALGSALFYYAIAEYYNTTPSTNTTTPIPPSSSSYASMMSNEEIEEILENCINHLTESISSPWTELSKKRKILCYLCRGKTYQRLKQYENSINDLTYCIQLYESNHEELEIENTTTIQSQDYDPSDAAYAYFRRAWSYKALQKYDLAANDFETAKLLKFENPNFSINYRSINNVEYIEIDTEPDLVEPFAPLMPVYAQIREE